MSAVDFFDSNVLIYLFDDAEPTQQRIARQRVAQALAEGTGCISHQVVQETLNVLTGKFQRPASSETRNKSSNGCWRRCGESCHRRSLHPCARPASAVPLQLFTTA